MQTQMTLQYMLYLANRTYRESVRAFFWHLARYLNTAGVPM
jgi:hypothetical protein